MSNISVSVIWEKPTVFAGEDIECRITFTNIAPKRRAPSPSPEVRASGPGQHRWKAALPLSKTISETHQVPLASKNQPQTCTHGHRAALSLGSRASPKQGDHSNIVSVGANGAAFSGHGHNHKRSVSIISIGDDLPNGEETHLNGQVSASQRPARNHGRAASLQVLPRRSSNTSSVPETGHLPMPPPFFRISTSTPGQSPPNGSAASQRVQSNPITASEYWTPHTITRKPSGLVSSSFKFPHASTSRRDSRETYHMPAPSTRPSASHSPQLPRPEEDPTHGMSHLDPMTRVISPANNDNTPRSSTDFYSMSNNSNYTLASEYIHHSSDRLSYRPAHGRRPSHLASTKQHKLPETLMMGYAQIIGSFTLDGSLINQAPFEDVKRRGALGGQSGGGVVGLESNKRDSGLFGALGWSNLGESLGGLLGGSELSSIKEIKDNTKSKSIPIITTPQSILFVDLRLGPGESKSYTYSHPLPRSIPPSHKGRAIKITYDLVIGTQRPKTTHQQHHLRHVDIPFRVLPGVSGQGDVLGHDLMAPYIILRSEGRTWSVDDFKASSVPGTKASALNNSSSSFSDFLSYSEKLLERGRQASSQGLLSPTDAEPGYGDLSPNEPISVKDAVDLAILSSNSTFSSNRGADRFEIARNGLGVAIIMLARPAYRLGESISAVIDFSHSDFSCYSLYATLETSEQVDSAIALRSSASISRVTRRIYASLSENTLFGRRAIFCPTIPLNATPGFFTSGVSLEWNLRFEFVTSRAADDEDHRSLDDALLEEVASDERGSVSAAVPGLLCESFDVTIPIKVYGVTAVNNEKIEVGNLPI